MLNSKKSIFVKQKDNSLFMTNPQGQISLKVLKEIENMLDNLHVKKVTFYLKEKDNCDSSTFENVCQLLLSYPSLDAKILKRKNILFSQKKLTNDERLIRTPHAKIISSPDKFSYEGILLKSKSKLYEIVLNTIICDAPSLVQFSFPIIKDNETNQQLLNHSAKIRSLILNELQEEHYIKNIKFFAYRNQKKDIIDEYVRCDNFKIIKCSDILPTEEIIDSHNNDDTLTVPPIPISKYKRKLLLREQLVAQAVNES